MSDKAKFSPTSPSSNSTPNVIKKESGESLSGGESSADHIIAESEGISQLSRSDKISPTSAYANPTELNEARKKKGEGLDGGESTADYLIAKSDA